MGLWRGLGLAGVVAALALVLASCAQPNSGNALGVQAVPAGHGNPLGIHPAGPANEPVCPGPVAHGSAGCTSRVIIDKQGKPSTSVTPAGYWPAQIQTAYGFSSVYGSDTASNVTIAIVDAYDDPSAAADLSTFKDEFNKTISGGTTQGINCQFTKYNQDGNVGPYPNVNRGWALEISLDVQWACAMAPDATVDLVEANSSSFTDLLAAVDTAVNTLHANVVSMSWGGSEFSSETSYDATFNQTGVTFTASSGDSGPGVVIYPAASPYVVGVGGTTLPLDSSGALTGSETPWSGSSGGVSAVESAPFYQSNLSGTAEGILPASKRGVPDVAYDANPSTGFSVYDSTGYQGTSGWFVVGGTSAGSPQWAALFALADQGRSASLSGTTGTAPNLTSPTYQLAGSSYSKDFHDITCSSSTGGGSGKGHGHGPKGGAAANASTGSTACSGYDLTTGLGSPQAGALISDLNK